MRGNHIEDRMVARMDRKRQELLAAKQPLVAPVVLSAASPERLAELMGALKSGRVTGAQAFAALFNERRQG